MSLLSNIDYGAIMVWRRNADVFFKTWKTNFLPSILEPLLYLIAFGTGIGVFIQQAGGIPYLGQNIDYIRFLAPGLVAISVMYSAFFECTYGSFVRMHYQKTFDAIVATPVSMEDVIVGEILWGATKSLLNATLVLVVIQVIGVVLIPAVLLTSWTVLLIPLVCFLGGLMFSGLAMIFTAVVPNLDSYNYPFYLLVTPMFLLSGTFFPVSSLGPVQPLAYVFPLTHATNLIRDLSYGTFQMWDPLGFLYVVVSTVVFIIPAIALMKKRLVK
jgi:lipooligosaccharide transport system permease protein